MRRFNVTSVSSGGLLRQHQWATSWFQVQFNGRVVAAISHTVFLLVAVGFRLNLRQSQLKTQRATRMLGQIVCFRPVLGSN